MNHHLSEVHSYKHNAVCDLVRKMMKRFSHEETSDFLIGWKIDVDSGDFERNSFHYSTNECTLDVIECQCSHDEFWVIAKNVNHKFSDDEEQEMVLQEIRLHEGRHSKRGMTKIPFFGIQKDHQLRARYGGYWLAPNPMLVPLTEMVLREDKPRNVAEPYTPIEAEPASGSVKEREAACLERLRANRERWASTPEHSSDAAPWVWSRLIRDVYGMRASGILTEWEVRFAGSLVRSSYGPDLRLSPRQQRVLRDIGQKLITKSALS